ncbi:hypothetical protein [Parendozoicomonas haliclonae]|uniref:Fido domain-containing protein n=1 Tax=Parendozoicomonas haliclonae TaxID=1960125 RepID=A0A1X7AQ51_9GAMM|nr:hypothetical protein [Parendozoicomonas haliclonae]SMA50228.1 hypothetical protein EHSB41UT_04021 [Parendozoicomonas haliclonae]
MKVFLSLFLLLITLSISVTQADDSIADQAVSSSRDPARALQILDNELARDQVDYLTRLCFLGNDTDHYLERAQNCVKTLRLVRSRFQRMISDSELPLFDMDFIKQINMSMLGKKQSHYRGDLKNDSEISLGIAFREGDEANFTEIKTIAEHFHGLTDVEMFLAPDCNAYQNQLTQLKKMEAAEQTDNDVYRAMKRDVQACGSEAYQPFLMDEDMAFDQHFMDGQAYDFFNLSAAIYYMVGSMMQFSPQSMRTLEVGDLLLNVHYRLYGLYSRDLDSVMLPLLDAFNQTQFSSWPSAEQREQRLYYLARTLLIAHPFSAGNSRTSIMVLNILFMASGLQPWSVMHQPNMRDCSSVLAPQLYRSQVRKVRDRE